MAEFELQAARKRYADLHNQLRNEGRNPLEAVAFLAANLNGGDCLSSSTRFNGNGAEVAAKDAGAALSVAFQEFLIGEARNGLGQYLTPLPVAEMIARVCAHTQSHTILDPFVGSALLLEQVAAQVPDSIAHGIEINDAVAAVARTVIRLSGREARIVQADAFLAWTKGEIARADAVVTNPPFGALATTVSKAELRRIGVADELLAMKEIPAELLGLELSVDVLADGGLLAIVLPQSVMTNTTWAPYRASLFRRLSVVGIVSLPEATFAPFRGVAKACVIFGRKQPAKMPQSVAFIRTRSIGYDDAGRSTGKSDVPHAMDTVLRGDGQRLGEVRVDGSFVMPASADEFAGPRHRLGDIAKIFTGRTLARSAYAEEGPWLLKVGDLKGSFIPWKERARVRIPTSVYAKNPRLHLRIGDVCLTCAAHRPRYIGLKVDLVDSLPPEGAMASAEVMVIRLLDQSPIRPEQLLFYLRSEAGYTQLQDLIRGSTAHLYSSDVEELCIPGFAADERADRLSSCYWEAARAFRRYLELEAEATLLGVTGWRTASELGLE